MLLQVAAACELFVTELAGERLLARVDALVPDQVRHLAECLPTTRVSTLVWFLAVVHARMLLQ